MDVLFGVQHMRRSSNTSLYSTTKVDHVKKMSSREQLLVEPPKHAKRVTFSKQRIQKPRHTTVKESEMQTGLTSCLITNPTLVDPRAAGGKFNR